MYFMLRSVSGAHGRGGGLRGGSRTSGRRRRDRPQRRGLDADDIPSSCCQNWHETIDLPAFTQRAPLTVTRIGTERGLPPEFRQAPAGFRVRSCVSGSPSRGSPADASPTCAAAPGDLHRRSRATRPPVLPPCSRCRASVDSRHRGRLARQYSITARPRQCVTRRPGGRSSSGTPQEGESLRLLAECRNDFDVSGSRPLLRACGRDRCFQSYVTPQSQDSQPTIFLI